MAPIVPLEARKRSGGVLPLDTRVKAGDEGVDIASVHGLDRLARDVNDIAYSDNRITRAGPGSGAQRGLQMGPAFQVASGGAKSPRESGMPQVLNALDHVVVVMFENRSFANLLGRLYEPGEVASFAGVIGKDLPNPARTGPSTGRPTGSSVTASRRT